MEQFKLTINVNALRATVIAASKEKTRYNLCCVAVDFTDATPTLVATNGHRMHVVRNAVTVEGSFVRVGRTPLGIPTAMVNAAIKHARAQKPKLKTVDVVVTPQQIDGLDGAMLALDMPGFEASPVASVLQFPENWKQTIPSMAFLQSSTTGVCQIAVHPQYLVDCAKAHDIVHDEEDSFSLFASPLVDAYTPFVMDRGDFTGVVMPAKFNG